MDLITCIKNYIKIVDLGSLTSVMHQTGIPVSVLSKQLSYLEKQVGKRLMHRTTRQMRVTEVGQIFYDKSQKILAAKQNAFAAVKNLDPEPHGKIRFGAPGAIFRTAYLRNIRAFLKQYPKIKIEFVNTLSPFALLDGEVDVVASKYQLDEANMIKHSLHTFESHVYASPEYLSCRGTPKRLKDLANHNCLLNRAMHPPNIWVFKDNQSMKVCGNFICENEGILVRAAVGGLGLVYVSENIVCKETEAKLLTKLSLEVKGLTHRAYLYHLWCEPDSPVRLFSDFMIKHQAV